uniref:Thioredoxin n=1 Tax=Polypedilum vanderplanki TaxID=319348 RepID=S6BEN2_POLVA|nr:thioredoxin [Polypedilum vanderplanki]
MFGNIVKLENFRPFFNPILRNISVSSKLFANNIFIVANDQDFEDKVLKSQKLLMVGFFEPYCNLCKMQLPRAEKIANEYKDKFSLAEVDIEQQTDVELKTVIKRIPSLAFYKNGEMSKEILEGVREMEEIRNFVEQNIEK